MTIRGRDIAVFLILTSHRAIFLSQFFKKSKKSFKSPWNMAYFVQNFLLIIFLKTIWANQIPPTHKIAKTVEKSAKIAPALGSTFSRLGPKSRKPLAWFFRHFLMILKRFLVWFYLLWVFQKSVLCESKYFYLWGRIFAWAYVFWKWTDFVSRTTSISLKKMNRFFFWFFYVNLFI